MDFGQQLQVWAKGDALQGKIMIGIGLVLTLFLLFTLKGNNSLLKGMLIPLSLLAIINLGYGGFLAFSRPKHMQTTTELYQKQATQIIQKELNKSKKDNKNYSNLKPIWTALIVVSLGLFFLFAKEYYKGLSLGLGALFFGFLLIDTLLHQRLKPYLNTLQDLALNQ